MKPAIALSAVAALLLSACATMPEPCTAAWVDWQKDQIFDDFVSENRTAIRTLRNLREDLEEPTALSALRIASAIEPVTAMVETFQERTVPDLRNALAQCGTTEKSLKLLTDLLEREGVDAETIQWIDTLGAFIPEDA